MIKDNKILAVPTNIITGFLGVGKTTAILKLLKNKPTEERWAILVNEFGEIGIDGSLFKGSHAEESGVFIREVPGGCMCCAAGLPMQIALNQLLSKAKPNRLLIEPTGLGHPKEVLQILGAKHYATVLDIQKNITLVDARKLREDRYTNSHTFNQQIEVADVIVGNKHDLYQPGDQALLESYVAKIKGHTPELIYANQGLFDPAVLSGPSKTLTDHKGHQHHEKTVTVAEPSIPECGFIQVKNEGEGYQSIGWRFSAETVFNYESLFNWLNGLNVERLKAVFITQNGIFGYNMTTDSLLETELDDCIESRIEIIAPTVNEQWQTDLLRLANKT